MPSSLPSIATIIHDGTWLSFYKAGHYEFFHRHRKPDAVAIIATTENHLILVSQKRPAHDLLILEIPAGLIDPGETPVDTAKRELMEETGFKSKNIRQVIDDVTVSPGICTETLYFVKATDCKKVGKGGGLAEENEHINIILAPLNDLDNFLKEQKKTHKIDMKIFVALSYLFAPIT